MMKKLQKSFVVFICLFLYTVNAAALTSKEKYATVMNYSTSQPTRISTAVELCNDLIAVEGTLLNLTKHLVANGETSHTITACELIPLTKFPKKIVWTLYPTAESIDVVRDMVVFVRNLYSIKKPTKTIDLALCSIERNAVGTQTQVQNAITALTSLKNLCISYTNLVDKQLNIKQKIKDLAFAIYSIQKGDEGVGNITAETIDINAINTTDDISFSNVTADRLKNLRNILIDYSHPTSTDPNIGIPQEQCVFFTGVSTELNQFITTYLVPCVRASLNALIINTLACEVPDTQRKVNMNAIDYTSFRLQKKLNSKQFVDFLLDCRISATQTLPIGTAGITVDQLTKVNGDVANVREHPADNTTIQANFKALTPLSTGEDHDQLDATLRFQIAQEAGETSIHWHPPLQLRLYHERKIEGDPVLATFFPSS